MDFPTPSGQLMVEVQEGSRVAAQSLLLTRAVKERLLDLRFQDVPSPTRVALKASIVREIVADICAYQSDCVQLRFSAGRVSFVATGSPYGTMTTEVDRGSEGLLQFDVGDDTLAPKYISSHFTKALAWTSHNPLVLSGRVATLVPRSTLSCRIGSWWRLIQNGNCELPTTPTTATSQSPSSTRSCRCHPYRRPSEHLPIAAEFVGRQRYSPSQNFCLLAWQRSHILHCISAHLLLFFFSSFLGTRKG